LNEFEVGDRVKVNHLIFGGHTGTIIGWGRWLWQSRWHIQLDQPTYFGRQLLRLDSASLERLSAEEDSFVRAAEEHH